MWPWAPRTIAEKERGQDTSSHQELLADINMDLPEGIDWHAGALAYVEAEIAKHGQEFIYRYMLGKPFARLDQGGTDGGLKLIENLGYLSNFLNAASLLNLPGGARIIDVACGSGWIAQYFARMGYDIFGFDISSTMIQLARKRLSQDQLLEYDQSQLEHRLFVLNIEREPLPPVLNGSIHAVILESCLHHFVDPITALANLRAGLNRNGVMLIIEGENRRGPLRPEYVSVMRQFSTLERPYTRDQLEGILDIAGLHHREFLGRVNGWYSPRDPRVQALSDSLRHDADAINFVLCATDEAAMTLRFPFRSEK